MASSLNQPIVLPRVQRPSTPGQPSVKQAGLTTAPGARPVAGVPVTRTTQPIMLPPIRPTAGLPAPGTRPVLPPVSRPTLPPVVALPVIKPAASAVPPGPALTEIQPRVPSPPRATSPKQPRPAAPTIEPIAAPAAAAATSVTPPRRRSKPAAPTRAKRRGQTAGAPRPPLPQESGRPGPIPEGFPEILPARPMPELRHPPPPAKPMEKPIPKILPPPLPSPEPSPAPAPVQANGRWYQSDGVFSKSGEYLQDGEFYISPEGTEPPYLPQDEQDIIDEHDDQPWSQAGFLNWNKGRLIIGDPEELFNFFQQFSSWNDLISRLADEPHQQLSESILLINSLDPIGTFAVYTSLDLNDEIDTEIHLV